MMPASDKLPRRALWTVLGAGLLARFFCAGLGVEMTADTMSYQISTMGLLQNLWPTLSLENTGSYPLYIVPELLQHNASDFLIERTPGFPLLMMGVLGLVHLTGEPLSNEGLYRGLVLANSVMGLAIALLVSLLGWRVFKSAKLALAVGLLAALSPNLIGSEHVALSEPLYTLSLLLLLFAAVRWQSTLFGDKGRVALLALGLLSGWLLWIKPVGLAAVLGCGVFLWLQGMRRRLLYYLAPILLMVLSWVAFQAQVHGGFLGYTAGGGMNQLYKVVTFLDLDSPLHARFKQELMEFAQTMQPENAYTAVNVVHANHLREEAKQPPATRRAIWQVYLEDDRQARAIAQEAIALHPARYIQVTLQQIPRTWLTPTPWDKALLYGGPLLALSLLGLILFAIQAPRKSPGFLLVWVLAFHTLLYAGLTLGDSRYRVPLEPVLIIFSVYAAQRLLESHRQARQSHPACPHPQRSPERVDPAA